MVNIQDHLKTLSNKFSSKFQISVKKLQNFFRKMDSRISQEEDSNIQEEKDAATSKKQLMLKKKQKIMEKFK